MDDTTSPLQVIWLLLLFIGGYCAPTGFAISRQHPQWQAIFVLNLLLGWTVLGWIIAMVWAFVRSQAQIDGRRQ